MGSCQVARCRQAAMHLYGPERLEICERHWLRHCDDDHAFDLRDEFDLWEAMTSHATSLDDGAQTKETTMSKTAKSKTAKKSTKAKAKKAKVTPQVPAMEGTAPLGISKKQCPNCDAPMKGRKCTKGCRPSEMAAAAADANLNVKPSKQELVVFAFRLTPDERTIIHQAAGPGKASKFVRNLAVLAAAKNHKAVKELMDQLN